MECDLEMALNIFLTTKKNLQIRTKMHQVLRRVERMPIGDRLVRSKSHNQQVRSKTITST
jgi:hypothetical protein